MKDDIVELQILNWQKYCPDSDQTKHWTFLKLPATFFSNNKIMALTPQERTTFIYILVQGLIQDQRGNVVTTVDNIRTNCGQYTNNIRNFLSRAQQLQLLSIKSSPLYIDREIDNMKKVSAEPKPTLTLVGVKEEKKERKTETKNAEVSGKINALLKGYYPESDNPSIQDLDAAVRSACKWVRSHEQYVQLETALGNYKAEISRRNASGTKYVMKPIRFVQPHEVKLWLKWKNPDTPQYKPRCAEDVVSTNSIEASTKLVDVSTKLVESQVEPEDEYGA